MTAKIVTPEEIEHLGKLAKIAILEGHHEKIAAELTKIVNHVTQLQEVDTASVDPILAGTNLKNSFRADTERKDTLKKQGIESFPKTQNGLLEVPPVFE
jgi:aspartyl-tRNA(Asn)/glutamyl-tRNA(Gln) amidotransferase subunit C